jgi:Rieske Fe-S protein
VARQGLDTAAHLVGDPIGAVNPTAVAEVPAGSGAIVEVGGHRFALYRDEGGRPHFLSPVCTHMGCIVRWNPAERSWDCPCHGGRYTALGLVQSGPPLRDLEERALPRESA